MGVKVNLHWAGHQGAFVSLLQELRSQEKFLDATLTAEGQSIKVHRFALMAHRPYFKVRRVWRNQPHISLLNYHLYFISEIFQ